MKKILAAITLLAMTSAAWAANVTFPSYWKRINARDYGTVCDNSTDDTAHIQAAIDAAYAAHVQGVYLPAGNCVISTSLFLDAPNNLRGSAAAWAVGTTYATNDLVTFVGVPWKSLGNGNIGHTPSASSTFWAQTSATPGTFAFSLCLEGDLGLGNHEGFGTAIRPTFNNAVALWVGTGQGMCVKNLAIIGPNNGYRGQQNGNGIAIGIAGGNGGASRTLIQDVQVESFYMGVRSEANSIDKLGDSNSFVRLSGQNLYYGVYISGFNPDIDDVVEPRLEATFGIVSDTGRPIHVWGGNLSATSGKASAFALSSTSALTATPLANGFSYTFTSVLTSPDQYVNTVYNAYMFPTAHFGVVPATLTAWNSGTSTGTFTINYNWSDSFFSSTNAKTATTLEADIQAVAKVYATERVTVFYGTGVTDIGTHIENPSACARLLYDFTGSGGDASVLLERLFFNYDPGMTQFAPVNSPSDANLALYYCAQSFPFIELGSSIFEHVKIADSYFGQTRTSEPVLIDTGGALNLIEFSGLSYSLNSPNFWVPNYNLTGMVTGSYQQPYSMGLGAGNWDNTPFLPRVNSAMVDYITKTQGYGLLTPFVGTQPAPWANPRIGSAQLTAWGTTLGALGTYPSATGQAIYSVLDFNSGALAHLYARSAHQFYSYGQNLTASAGNGQISGLSWTYKGQSFALYLDATTIKWMYAGLAIGLDNGGGNVRYVVTGVYPGLGYVTVLGIASDASAPTLLTGTAGTTYTGSTIAQQSYSFTQY